MIHSALQFLTGELDTYLNNKAGTSGVPRVLLTAVSSEGKLAIPNKTLGLSLMNIEEDRSVRDQRNVVRNESGTYEFRNPDLYLNLYVLITANFNNSDNNTSTDDYAEGLKQLSHVIGFFQSRSVFVPSAYPGMALLDPDMERLTVEMFSFTFEQMHNFWSLVGASYMPSVLYKVRMLTIQENELTPPPGVVETIGLNLKGN
ncbi:MAG: DUF4255 domain-containing protein [Bacteroidetes bacterium]|nr:DUF4255 domain-containing protein [Bacteroidota bacterium]